MSEVIFREGSIEITKELVKFSDTTYPIRQISAVSSKKIQVATEATGCAALAFGFCGIIVFTGFYSVFTSGEKSGEEFLFCLIIGVISGLVGFRMLQYKRPAIYGLSVSTSGGEKQIFQSSDFEQLQRIKHALERAIIA